LFEKLKPLAVRAKLTQKGTKQAGNFQNRKKKAGRQFQPFLIVLKHYFAAGAAGASAAGAAGAAGASAAGAGAAGAAVSAGLGSSFLPQPTTAKETVAIKNIEIMSANIFFIHFHLLSSI
jgi:hypothetical protein